MSLADRFEDAAAEPDDAPRWPPCHWCSRTAEPGLACTQIHCPWHREFAEDGVTLVLVRLRPSRPLE